ncbi:MAG: reverse transcriptase domain-containing protein, partial [bacterium]
MVLKLERGLYGTKQAPRVWNTDFTKYCQEYGLLQSVHDHCLFFKQDLWVTVYVDDICIFSPSQDAVKAFIAFLESRYKIRDLGELRYILGIEVERDRKNGTMHLGQQKYIRDCIRRFGLPEETKGRDVPIQPNLTYAVGDSPYVSSERAEQYRSLIGSLMYLMTKTRPDIAYAVSILSRF